MLTIAISSIAMSYEQARMQALFLADKMAYELNLTEEQYEAVYEINLDYLMNVNTVDDLYGRYWTHRNLDLSYVLLDWQYRSFVDAAYFYRPLRWDSGYWRFGIYARYPHRDYYYFGRPRFYNVYRGGHSWRMNNNRSWYNGRTFYSPRTNNGRFYGMRDGFQSGRYQNGFDNGRTRSRSVESNRSFGQQQNRNFSGSRSYGTFNSNRQSSTRTTVTSPRGRDFEGSRSFGNGSSRQPFNRSFSPSSDNRTFGGSSRSFGGGTVRQPSGNTSGSSRFGGHR